MLSIKHVIKPKVLLDSSIWYNLAALEISHRYKRSVIGPFWITLTMCLFIVSVGFLYSKIFNQDIKEFIQFLAIGLVFWNFLSVCAIEGSNSLFSNRELMLNTRIQPLVIIYSVVAKNFIILLHTAPILIITSIFAWERIEINVFAFLIGVIIFSLNVCWVACFLAIISARYRDIPPLVAALTQLVFILSPIIWPPETVPEKNAFVLFNPVSHLIKIVREPLMTGDFAVISLLISSVITVIGILLTIMIYKNTEKSLRLWV